MPLLILLSLALVVGVLVAALGSRYPTPVVGQEPARAAAEALGAEGRRRPWLRRMLRGRLDPATATGLALTLTLAVVIAGGTLVGLLAYLVRSSDTMVRIDTSAGEWGVHHATAWSTRALRLVTTLGVTWFVVLLALVVTVVEMRRAPSRWLPVFLLTVIAGDVILVNTIKQLLGRVRPTFDPLAATLGPSFPSGHTALAAAGYAALALVLSRRRGSRARSLLAGAAAGIAVAVAASRVLLGLHWLSDVVAGLAFGWAWFAACSVAFGGRLLTFGVAGRWAAEASAAPTAAPALDDR